MKKFFIALSLAAGFSIAHADTGPYYISYPGYCNVKQIYVNVYGDIYGNEVGCSVVAVPANERPLMGTFLPGGAVAETHIHANTPCMSVYAINGLVSGGCSNGYIIGYAPRSNYTVRLEAGTPNREFNITEEMPDTTATRDLPATPF